MPCSAGVTYKVRMKLKTVHALLLAMLGAGIAASPQPGLAAGTQDRNPSATSMRVASADCYAVGQRIASQQGGTLAAAQAASRGGRQVCVIVVLIPGEGGQRPRRQEIVVPQ